MSTLTSTHMINPVLNKEKVLVMIDERPVCPKRNLNSTQRNLFTAEVDKCLQCTNPVEKVGLYSFGWSPQVTYFGGVLPNSSQTLVMEGDSKNGRKVSSSTQGPWHRKTKLYFLNIIKQI